MNTFRRTLAHVVLVSMFASAAGCTFGTLARETRAPAAAAIPPCFSGDICGATFDGPGFTWMRDAMQLATGR
jgi:hypothetical protein